VIDARIRIVMDEIALNASARQHYQRLREHADSTAYYSAIALALGLARLEYEYVGEAIRLAMSEAGIERNVKTVLQMFDNMEIDKAEIISKSLSLISVPAHLGINEAFENSLPDVRKLARLSLVKQAFSKTSEDEFLNGTSDVPRFASYSMFGDEASDHAEMHKIAADYGGEMLDDSNYGPPDREVDYREIVGEKP